ncbi:hypothetical protein LOAG_00634 [Loa loa]|uniref:Uncharacterized protein n=2 Tax=Loa loa TaxID=7209 RepID=A0A1S0UBI9_LOALO|nr:hypothetical protein LOAG_00634 [Loa loa]EFO27842.2 hypothetical protein LOAG_00634 [Loa loa]
MAEKERKKIGGREEKGRQKMMSCEDFMQITKMTIVRIVSGMDIHTFGDASPCCFVEWTSAPAVDRFDDAFCHHNRRQIIFYQEPAAATAAGAAVVDVTHQAERWKGKRVPSLSVAVGGEGLNN